MSDQRYVYLHAETTPEGYYVYTVGFYAPDGEWMPESDYNDKQEAAARVHFLNGGS